MAKKIINGKMYNTDTTQVIGTQDNGYTRGDFYFEEQTLHKKKTGEYFVYAHGGAYSSLVTLMEDKAVLAKNLF